MEKLGTRTVDDLGRIILPKEVREVKGWKKDDKITFYNYNGVIVIETESCGQAQEPGQIESQAQGSTDDASPECPPGK